MRIAFVGKGGSGKSTVTALFSQYISNNKSINQWLIDADLNINLGKLVGIPELDSTMFLSSEDAQTNIKSFLIGTNIRIESLGHLKKTTPPTHDSNFIYINDDANFIFKNYSTQKDSTYLSVVGTYQGNGIGTSCYHNNLSILENILSHSIDTHSYIIADMVAGIDAFAGTLHSQFDILVFVAEPTIKSIDVFNQYYSLAKEAGIDSNIFVVGNKIKDKSDEDFICGRIENERLVGLINESNHIRSVDKGIETLTIKKVESEIKEILKKIDEKLLQNIVLPQKRLEYLYDLHKKYIAQAYVKDRFGDLTAQIDTTFNIHDVIKKYESK